jgi:acetate kinase
MTAGLEKFGIAVDAKKNAFSLTRNVETDITAGGSPVRVFVIPTDEELVMVEDTVALLEGRYEVHTKFAYSFQRSDYVNKLREELFERETKERPELLKVRVKAPL